MACLSCASGEKMGCNAQSVDVCDSRRFCRHLLGRCRCLWVRNDVESTEPKSASTLGGSAIEPFSLVRSRLNRFPLGSTNLFRRNDHRPICVEVRLPQGFSGGSYELPFRPVAPSPPALYDNGSPQRRGIDYTVSDNTIVVNFRPAPKDSLSVWYTTDDPFPRMLP